MRKRVMTALALVIALAIATQNALVVGAAPVSEQRQIVISDSDNCFEIIPSELEGEEIEIEIFQNSEYLLSVEEGWIIEKFESSDEENESIVLEIPEIDKNEMDKTSLKIRCNELENFELLLYLKNELTNEEKTLTCKVSILPKPLPKSLVSNRHLSSNVGNTKVYPNFIVPEASKNTGISEAPITDPIIDPETPVEKKDYPPIEISEDNIEFLGNGEFRISIPSNKLPEGVACTYTVNGQQVDEDYVLSELGTYVVKIDFTVSDTEHYNPIESSEVVYNVKEKKEEPAQPADYEMTFNQISCENGVMKLELVLICNPNATSSQGIQAVLKYDKDAFSFSTDDIELHSDWSFGFYNEERDSLVFTPNFSTGVSPVAILSFTKKNPDTKASTISIENITVLDRMFGRHPVDDLEEVVTELPKYDIYVPKSDGTFKAQRFEDSTSVNVRTDENSMSKSSDTSVDESVENDIDEVETFDSIKSVDTTSVDTTTASSDVTDENQNISVEE